MKKTLTFCFYFSLSTIFAQNEIEYLRNHINILAADKMEGRRTGTKGGDMAAKYIAAQFKSLGLSGKKATDKNYFQYFTINEGKTPYPKTKLTLQQNDKLSDYLLFVDYFPMAFCNNETLNIGNKKQVWYDIADAIEANEKNPHPWPVKDIIANYAKEARDKGGEILWVYNSRSNDLQYESSWKADATIPVFYLTKKIFQKGIQSGTKLIGKANIGLLDSVRKAANIVGYKDNKAKRTVIIGAHYDHLGYGEDRNSMYKGEPAIHNGADDNASGTTGLFYLINKLKNNKEFNFLYLAFSGEELGLHGSKYFAENKLSLFKNVMYMINMDMIGRFSDSTNKLTVGGIGTAKEWGNIVKTANSNFILSFDSTGAGPSDHTSFYRKNVPVLYFFTGLHSDYHKPTDDADKINVAGMKNILDMIVRVVNATTIYDSLSFQKTKEQTMGVSTARFKVTLGLMLDYTYNVGDGIKVDGVTEGKPAQKAGILPGDILISIEEYKTPDVSTYMSVLGKLDKGKSYIAKVNRQGNIIDIKIDL